MKGGDNMNNVLMAFLLTLLAGLATGIGSCIAFFAKKTNKKFLCVSLGFSAGVMIYVSMIEMFQTAKESLVGAMGIKEGKVDIKDKTLMRTGIVTALAIAIHNFPEGLATFVSALEGASLEIPITIAIAIHNIPEGISVSIPIFYATGDKKKAFLYSFLSGMSEPIGAIIGYTLLRNIFNDITLGILLSAVAGIMVFISLDELLPTARKYGEHHLAIYGLIAGMVVMAVSLLLFI